MGLRLCLVHPRHREADVDQNPVTDLDTLVLVVDETYVDVAPDPAHFGFCEQKVLVEYLDYPTGNSQAHLWPPFVFSISACRLLLLKTLSANIACPSASPPSLGGTRWCVWTTNCFSSSRSVVWVSRSMFWNVPPERATALVPSAARSSSQTVATIWAIVRWKVAEMSGAGRPESRSSTTAAKNSRVSTIQVPPSGRRRMG